MRILLLLVLAACSPGSAEKGAEGPTWHADVKPLVDTHCVRCHSPNGTGPIDLTSQGAVEQWSDRMLARMEAGEMPPPVADPTCRDYVGSEHLSLAPESVETFRDWLDGGQPEGKKSDATPATEVVTELDGTDLSIQLIAPHRPTFDDARHPDNEYRCFALEHGRDEAFYVTALGPRIDATPMVHHIVVYVDDEGNIPDHDPAEGWDCINDMDGLDDGMIAGWAPGALPYVFPEGTGYRVEADERVVMQMHYYNGAPDDTEMMDQSGYDFRTADSVSTELMMIPYGDYGFLIPAGARKYSYGFEVEIPETIQLSEGVEVPFPELTLYGVFPHMHVLGTGYEFTVFQDDGTEECVVRSDNYDFDNQLTYDLKEPVVVGPGDRIWWSCTWDNSNRNPNLIHNPPIDIGYGERTDEEMCWAFTLGSIGW
ncbi:MAG: hypothetical protein ACI8PZ_004744 [Myxococcota bacterium]|jgi:hypothetical protein